MFNLTVDTAHTFYVGGQGWLVHNTTNYEDCLRQLEALKGESPFRSPYDPNFPGRPDPKWSVDTASFSGKKTAAGGVRNTGEFWKVWAQMHPETLSRTNMNRALNYGKPVFDSKGNPVINPKTGKQATVEAPKIDRQWIKSFPEHKDFAGDTIIHHHVGQGRYAIPVPGGAHIGSGGPFHYTP